jgi:hypothetical protein
LIGVVLGVLGLLWFVVRVVPKPSRAAYPCQRAAFPVASAFVLWLAASIGSLMAANRLRAYLPRVALGLGIIGGVGAASWLNANLAACAFEPASRDGVGIVSAAASTEPGNQPTGIARGIKPGRVVWAHDAASTQWSGNRDGSHWWDPGVTDQSKVDAMLSGALRHLTGATSDAQAWDALFRSFNKRRGNGDIGYADATRETIAIKINQNPTNQNDSDYYAKNGVNDDEYAITGSPHAILALVKSLVAAGVKDSSIIIADPTGLNRGWGGPRTIGDNIFSYVRAVHSGVRFVDGVGKKGRELAKWPTTDNVLYANGRGGDESKGKRIPQQFLDAGFIINMAIMKNHGDGPTVVFKNHYGSVSGQRHGPMYGEGSYYSNMIEPMGHLELGEKTLLYIVDALYGSSSPNGAPTKWNKPPFSNVWPSSVFLSEDGVAMDSVAFDFMNFEWGLSQDSDYYLHEAASVPDEDGKKLSGTVYRPTVGNSTVLGSLGVHEHWNNPTDRQYSRNLDPANGKGIELILTEPGDTTLPEAGPPPPGDGGNSSVPDSAIPGDSGNPSIPDSSTPGDSNSSASNDASSADGDPGSGGCSCRLGVSHRGGLLAIGFALACMAVVRLRRSRDQS